MVFEVLITPQISDKDTLNHIRIFNEDGLIANAMMTLDEIEDLEGNLTDVLLKLSRYRRAKQREEF